MRLPINYRSRSIAGKLIIIFTVVLAAATLAVVASADNSELYADGNGSPEACLTNPNQNPNAANVQSVSPAEAAAGVDVGAGFVVEGVCISTGTAGHSGVLGDGSYAGDFGRDGCYLVDGVGTQEVTVTRIGDEGPDCQDISHVDVIRAPANGTTTTTTTPTTTPTTAAAPPRPAAAPPAPAPAARPTAPAPGPAAAIVVQPRTAG